MHIWRIWQTCKASLQPTVVNTFDFNCQLLGQWGPGIWNGSWERPGYHSNCISRGVITKDGSHSSHRDLWVCILLNTCARRRRRDEHDVKIKSNKVSNILFELIAFSGFFPTRESNLVSLLSGSLTLIIDCFAWVWKQGNLHVNR